MRMQVHRLCVENLPDTLRNVDIAGEPRRLFGLGLGEALGGNAVAPI
jgi:hypothetical protein